MLKHHQHPSTPVKDSEKIVYSEENMEIKRKQIPKSIYIYIIKKSIHVFDYAHDSRFFFYKVRNEPYTFPNSTPPIPLTSEAESWGSSLMHMHIL